jgi:hypothetical protein
MITYIIFLGVLFFVSNLGLFPNEDVSIGTTEEFQSWKTLSNTTIFGILNDNLAVGVIGAIIFGMLLYMRVPMLSFLSLLMPAMASSTQVILSRFSIPDNFIILLQVAIYVVGLFSIMQYFSRIRMEEV